MRRWRADFVDFFSDEQLRRGKCFSADQKQKNSVYENVFKII